MDDYIRKVLYPDPVRKGGQKIEVDSEERGILDLLRLLSENQIPVETIVGDPEAKGNKRAAAKKLLALDKLCELGLIEKSDGSVSPAPDVEIPWPIPGRGPSFEGLRKRFQERGERARKYLEEHGIDPDNPPARLRKHLKGNAKKR